MQGGRHHRYPAGDVPASALTQQIQQLQHTLETVEHKCWFYETAKATGTVDIPGAMTDEDVPDQFRAIRRELRGQSKEQKQR